MLLELSYVSWKYMAPEIYYYYYRVRSFIETSLGSRVCEEELLFPILGH